MTVIATFPTPAAFFEALHGPRDHDEHVRDWRHEMWLCVREAASRRAYEAMLDELAVILREMRARQKGMADGCAEVRARMAKPRHLRVVA